MKHIITIISISIISFSALAQYGGIFLRTPPTVVKHRVSGNTHEFVKVYYYNNHNNI